MRLYWIALILAFFAAHPASASRSWQQFDSLTSVIASKRLMLDVARAGNRFVAVGAFGHVMLSDDQGKTWRQAKTPISTTLNAVHFPSENIGYAVGQDNIILKTNDAGESWQKIHIDPDILNPVSRSKAFSDEPRNCGGARETDDCLIPLFSVYFHDDNNGFIVGAFGQALFTSDGGQSWTWRPFPKALVKDEFEDPNDPNDDFIKEQAHLNKIAKTANGNVYVAAEYGTVYRSTDGGKNFKPLLTGYNGSFWGILTLGNSVLAYGMRGNIWRSDNQGRTWQKLETGARQSFHHGVRLVRGLVNGQIVFVGLNGVIAISRDGGRSFRSCTRPERRGYAAIAEGQNGNLILLGENGISHIQLDNPCQ